MIHLEHFRFVVPLLMATLVLVWLASFVFQSILRINLRKELIEERNPAVGILIAAFLIAMAIALEGLFFGRHAEDGWVALGRLVTEGVLVIPLILASIWINDRLILYRFDIAKEVIQNQNIGVALAVSGSCLASGLVVDGALTGYSESWLIAIGDIVLFWCVAQLLMVLTVFLTQACRQYNFQSILKEDENLSIGISILSFLVSLGMICRSAVIHAGQGTWLFEATVSLVLAAAGISILMIGRLWISPFFMKRKELRDEIELDNNFVASLALSGAQLAFAFLVSAAIQRPSMEW